MRTDEAQKGMRVGKGADLVGRSLGMERKMRGRKQHVDEGSETPDEEGSGEELVLQNNLAAGRRKGRKEERKTRKERDEGKKGGTEETVKICEGFEKEDQAVQMGGYRCFLLSLFLGGWCLGLTCTFSIVVVDLGRIFLALIPFTLRLSYIFSLVNRYRIDLSPTRRVFLVMKRKNKCIQLSSLLYKTSTDAYLLLYLCIYL